MRRERDDDDDDDDEKRERDGSRSGAGSVLLLLHVSNMRVDSQMCFPLSPSFLSTFPRSQRNTI